MPTPPDTRSAPELVFPAASVLVMVVCPAMVVAPPTLSLRPMPAPPATTSAATVGSDASSVDVTGGDAVDGGAADHVRVAAHTQILHHADAA